MEIKRLPLLFERVRDLNDEYSRLDELDSEEMKLEFVPLLQEIQQVFIRIDDDLKDNLKEYLKQKSALQGFLKDSRNLHDELVSGGVFTKQEISQYTVEPLKCFNQELEAQGSSSSLSVKAKKSVRFKDGLIDPPSSSSFDPSLDLLKLNLFQTDNESVISTLTDDLSNRELFIQNQQQILQQDSMLEDLSASVRTQYSMGTTINEELDDHMIILNDLEQMIEGTGAKLDRGMRRVGIVNTKIRELGPCYIIAVLLIILILLLIFL